MAANNFSPIGQQLGLLGDLTGAGQVGESDEDRKKRLLAMQQRRLQPASPAGGAVGSLVAGTGYGGY
jgi:hypothetical protein